MADERTAPRQERWRLRIGVLVFIAGFAAPAAIPLIAASTLPMIWKTILSGALAVGVPEVMMVAAIAIMGKAGFAQLKQRLGRLMRQYGPPQHVGPARYRIGLVLFFLPLLVGWLGVYVWHLVPGFEVPGVRYRLDAHSLDRRELLFRHKHCMITGLKRR